MQWGSTALAFYEVGAAALAASVATLRKRLELSQAKYPSLAGHARIARRLARFVPFYEYSPERFFCSDGAPRDIAELRRAAFEELSQIYRARFAETIRCTAAAAQTLSDLQFTGTYRVPFQYRSLVRAHLPSASFVAWRDAHRSRWQCQLRPHWLVRRQPARQRLLQGYDRTRRCTGARTRAGARFLSPGRRRKCADAARYIGAGRGFLPYVGHRSGDAGRAARALSHPPIACRVL